MDNPIYLVIAQNNANCSSYSFVLPRGEKKKKGLGWRFLIPRCVSMA
jgi:hypothetical protein